MVVEENEIVDNICFVDSSGSIDINVSGGVPGYSFNWSNGATTEDIFNLEAGEYTVTVSDNENCEKIMTFVVSSPDELALDADSFEETCEEQNGRIILYSQGGVPPYEYKIDGDWTSSSYFYNFAAGWYTASVRDYNDCITEIDVYVDEIPPPVSEAGPSMELSCNASTVQLDGSGSSTGSGYSYQWTTENGNIVDGATTLYPTVDAAGTYVLEVFDVVYDCIEIDSTVVTEDENIPIAIVASPDEINCNNSTVTLDGSGSSSGSNITYLWTTDDGNIVSGGNTNTAVVDAGGRYILSVTNNENGCTSTFSQTVVENTNNPVYTVEGITLTCNNPSDDICVTVTSAFDSVVWNANGEVGTCLTVSEGGDYGFTVYGSNGCTSIDTVTVEDQTTLPIVNIATPEVLGCGITMIDIDGSASASGTEFSYSWTTTNGHFVSGTDQNTATVDQAGVYYLTVYNTLTGCSSTDSVEVFNGVQSPDASFTYTVDFNTATLYGKSLQGAYTSTWVLYGSTTISGDTATFSFNDNGDYDICHYQENNCGIDTSCQTVSITAIQPLTYSDTVVNVSCYGESDGSISIIGSGGIGALSISWTGANDFSSTEFQISGW